MHTTQGRLEIERGPEIGARGRLILVTCADMGRLDLVLCAAASRLAQRHDVHLAQPVVTRLLPAGGGLLVNGRALAALAAAGDLCLGWRCAGRPVGYTRELAQRLRTGGIVLAAAPQEVEAEARMLWPHATIIRLVAGTESLRAGISPWGRRHRRADADVCIRDVGDLPASVAALTAAIETELLAEATSRGASAEAAPLVSRPSEQEQSRPVLHGARRGRKAAVAPIARADKPQTRALSPT